MADRHLLKGGWVLSALLIPAGCELIGGFKDFEGIGGSGATTGSSTSGGAACGAGAPDAGGRMVAARLSNGTCFWIDEHEVTVADYAKFLASSPDPSIQDTACLPIDDAGNTTFAPAACRGDAGPQTDGREPVVCVTWCDALKYCNSVGKRLCAGDALTMPADPATSEWYAACSADGANVYPYGDGHTYEGQTCDGYDNAMTGCRSGTCSLVEVASSLGCHTPSGLFDMSGNASEWTNECDSTGPTAMCAIRGGGVGSDAQGLACKTVSTLGRLRTNEFVGFRCCAGGT
jgi:formylglycine-generating enzyme required for sulfatase activity